jgi:hypothetical protein
VKQVELLPAAEAELDAAVEWYEERASGFGLALADAVEWVLALIRVLPTTTPAVTMPARDDHSQPSRLKESVTVVLAADHGAGMVNSPRGRANSSGSSLARVAVQCFGASSR